MTACKARRYSDQMQCECGRAWDMNDPDPPECGELPVERNKRIGAETVARLREFDRCTHCGSVALVRLSSTREMICDDCKRVSR